MEEHQEVMDPHKKAINNFKTIHSPQSGMQLTTVGTSCLSCVTN